MCSYDLPDSAPAIPDATQLATARRVVAEHLLLSPLLALPRSAGLPGQSGAGRVFVKWEGSQPSGSFKVRGGISAVTEVGVRRRLVAASAGNHGAGLAWAARRLGGNATVVIPESTPAVKQATLAQLGAEVIVGGPDYDAAEAHALELAASGAVFVSAYNDTAVIAGQSTIVAEIQDQLPDADQLTVVVPVGGGGLLAGSVLAAGASTRCVGVESAASQAFSAAVQAGRHQPVMVGETIADGLAGNIAPDSMPPAVVAGAGVPLLAVSEAQIQHAVAWAARNLGLICEGSAVTPLAAYLAGMLPGDMSGDVVLVLTGRNIDEEVFTSILATE